MNTLEKLTAAAKAAEDARVIYSLKIAARNQIVITALDEGYEKSRIAAAAGLVSSTIITIAAQFDNQQEQSRTPE